MAENMDTAAARREARRLRILANAENRFKRITTVQDISGDTASNEALFHKISQAHETRQIQSHKNEQGDSCANANEAINRAPHEEELFGAYLNRHTSDQVQATVNYRIIIIMLLGLIVRYINLIFYNCEGILGIDLTFMHIDKIFVPFLIYVVTEYFLFPPNVELNNVLQLVFALNNLQGQWVKVFLNTVNHFLAVLKDMFVYFFAFVFLDTVFALFNVDDDYLYKSLTHA